MWQSKKLKWLTLSSHALILTGAFHGLLMPLVLAIALFPYFHNDHFTFRVGEEETYHFATVGFLTLVGQIFMFCTFFGRSNFRSGTLLASLFAFWLSLFYIWLDGQKAHIDFAWVTATPFALCSIHFFTGNFIKRAYWWAIDRKE